TRSPGKAADARLLGADGVILSTDNKQMRKYKDSFDFLLNTIPVGHDVEPNIRWLKRDATMVLVGAFEPLEDVNGKHVIGKRNDIAGSLIRGIQETQEMQDFCAEHNVLPEVETMDMHDINTTLDRVVNGDVSYGFVIDIKSFNA